MRYLHYDFGVFRQAGGSDRYLGGFAFFKVDMPDCGGAFGDSILVGVEIDWAYKRLQFNGPLDDLTLLGQPVNIRSKACPEACGWGALASIVTSPALHRTVGLYAATVGGA